MTPWQQTIGEVAAGLGTDARKGLTNGEVHERLERFGPNELKIAYAYDYRNQVSSPDIRKGDSAFFATLLFKF